MISAIQSFSFNRPAYTYQQPQFKGKAKALYAGSFDPITKGHMDIIKSASEMFDKLVVLIAKNPAKKGFLPVEDRAKLIKEAVEEINLNNVTIDIAPNDLLTVDYAKANGASVLVRGLRTVTDFDSEMQLAEINKKLNRDVRTVFLTSNSEYSAISSSAVRGILACHGNITEFVPNSVTKYLYLKDRWDSLKDKFGIQADFTEISRNYNAKERKYHDLNHIYNVIKHIEDFNRNNPNVIEDIDELIVSAFLHDICLGPDDIKMSIEKAKSLFKDGCPEQIIKNIQATDHAKLLPKEASVSEKVLADADLAILGTIPENYRKYSKQIREEYSQYSDKEYAEGRTEVLRNFLLRDRIFQTDYFYMKYESNACQNIGSEINQLKLSQL